MLAAAYVVLNVAYSIGNVIALPLLAAIIVVFSFSAYCDYQRRAALKNGKK